MSVQSLRSVASNVPAACRSWGSTDAVRVVTDG